MLTSALLRAGARVRAIEPDPQLAARLRHACPTVLVVEATVLSTPWPDVPFRVVANLPFAHATDICRALFSDPLVPLRSAHVIVEWDAAVKRARVWPSTMLGVLWGAWFELSVPRRVASAAFAPPPRVSAAVLAATRRPHPLVPACDAGAYGSFLSRAYRSGTLPPCARKLAPELGIDPRADPRDLDARAWAALWQETSASPRTVKRMSRRRRKR